MKNLVKVVLIVAFFCMLSVVSKPVAAQCAMCSTTVESSAESGSTTTNGLNNGIIYLLAAPYLAVAIGGYVWYKNYRRKDVQINVRDEKLHLN
jgi:hypothetical protein